ncbi:MAG: DTW domain-containing protein [Planctomycetes bacterium]|nr:DTW domain-containing protein [Planctomycetota bacterium]
MPTPAAPEPKQRCYRCLRPLPMCYCAQLPSVPTRTRIVILQHPHERTHPFGTARLARLCLPNATVHVPWAGFTGTLEQRVEVPADAAVLYPHPDAPLLQDLPPERRPSTLIAIDGTWAHAKRLYRENVWLHGMQHVRLDPSAPSRYRIRKEPRPDYVSTLEAILEALRMLEPDTPDLDAPLLAFDRMIDQQIAHRATVPPRGRHKSERQRPSRALSRLLGDPRLVVAYAESALLGGDPAGERRLVQWTAAKLDGSMFEALLAPGPGPQLPYPVEHMGLSGADFLDAEPLELAVARFRAWLEPGAPVSAWTPTTLEWGEGMLPPNTERTSLKTNWCNLRNRRAGFLENVIRNEQLAPVPNDCRGRARSRLGNALAVAQLLCREYAAR